MGQLRRWFGRRQGRTRSGLIALALAAVSCASFLGQWPASLANATGVPRLTWYGQSCFLLETAAGTRILMDPGSLQAAMVPPEGVPADLVTVSHEHPDHTYLGLSNGTAKVVRGLTADKKGWLKIKETFRDVSIRTIGVYHDEELGAKQGLNTIFVLETGGLRVAHLGDLGHALSDQQLSELGQVDVVLVPIGGRTTLDADRAARVVDQIRPRLLVLPMHYKTDAPITQDLDSVEAFISGRPHVRKVEGRSLPISGLKKRPGAEVVVFE